MHGVASSCAGPTGRRRPPRSSVKAEMAAATGVGRATASWPPGHRGHRCCRRAAAPRQRAVEAGFVPRAEAARAVVRAGGDDPGNRCNQEPTRDGRPVRGQPRDGPLHPPVTPRGRGYGLGARRLFPGERSPYTRLGSGPVWPLPLLPQPDPAPSAIMARCGCSRCVILGPRMPTSSPPLRPEEDATPAGPAARRAPSHPDNSLPVRPLQRRGVDSDVRHAARLW